MIFLTYSSHSFLVINSEEIDSTIFSDGDNVWIAAHNPRARRTATGRTARTGVVVSCCPLLADGQCLGVRNDDMINESKALKTQHFSPTKEYFKILSHTFLAKGQLSPFSFVFPSIKA